MVNEVLRFYSILAVSMFYLVSSSPHGCIASLHRLYMPHPACSVAFAILAQLRLFELAGREYGVTKDAIIATGSRFSVVPMIEVRCSHRGGITDG